MDIDLSKELLDILIENSSRILVAGFGVNWAAESSFFNVVRLLQDEVHLREYFGQRVRETLSLRDPGVELGQVPIELIELVAHEFRWPELLEMAEQRVGMFYRGDARLAIGDRAGHIREAYNDDWENREFYDRYKK